MDKVKRPQTAQTNSSQSTQAVNPFTQSNSKTLKQLSYKDYTIKEENSTSKQKMIPKQNMSDLKTTLTSSHQKISNNHNTEHFTTYQFKQNVQRQFNNFMNKCDQGSIDDDDSLLQDSQASKTRDEKQYILQEQKAKRHHQKIQKQRQEEANARKKQQGLEKIKSDAKTILQQQAKLRQKSKSRERSQEKTLKKKTAELVKRHKPEVETIGAAAQLQDLRTWIEVQMHEEKLDDAVCDISDSAMDNTAVGHSSKTKENTSGNTQISLSEVGIKTDKQKVKLLKHQLPGNSLLSEKEDSKIGSRQNRYGVFETGPDDFKKVVEIQREKQIPKQQQQNKALTPEQQKQSKEQIKQMIIQLAQKNGIMFPTQTEQQNNSQKQSNKAAPKPDNLSEDSCDKVPVRDNSHSQKRPMINQKVKELDQLNPNRIPGVTNTHQTQQKTDLDIKVKESRAAIVIQKFLRGHWGRREFQRQVYRRKEEIEIQYGRFEYEYKQAKQYNIKQYLNDKQKLRKQSGLDSINEEIAEVIGESSNSTAQMNVKLQNFFYSKAASQSDKDPLSLIAIYAQRHNKLPASDGVKPHISSQKTAQKQNDKKRNKNKQNIQSSSSIVEDIYSEKFDEDDIVEDIPQISSSVGSSVKKPKQVQNKNKKTKKAIAESDSIIDEVLSAHLSKSEGDSSIADEAAPAEDESAIESSIMEDSIIRDEYDSSNVKVSQAEKSLEARNRGRFGINQNSNTESVSQQKQQILLKSEEEKASSAIKSKNMISQMLTEMKEYEAANINSNMMDRMEKVVISSLAQKDQIIMAQTLLEKDREIRHREEINRIKEEQIRLMTQLLLFGGLGNGNPSSVVNCQNTVNSATEKQRQDLLNTFQQMISQQNIQPQLIENQQPMSHQQYYQQAQRKSMSYLEEYDQSKRSSNKISSGKYGADQFNKSDNSIAAAPKPTKINNNDDDIEDEVGSINNDDSIQEDFEESYVSSSSSFEELKKRQYKLFQQKLLTLDNLATQIEEAIDREREGKERRLDQKLKSRKISPRTFTRQRSDLESWTQQQRKELRDQHRKLTVEQQIAEQQIKLVAGVKERQEQARNFGNQKLVENSNDSEDVKQALNQAHLLDKGLIGTNADQKYIQRKKEAADRLLKEKEKAIQEQLDAKLKIFEKEQADEVLKRALDLDIDKEAQRRFEAVKRQLEESQGHESARSAISQSKDSNKFRKNVKFAEQQIGRTNNHKTITKEDVDSSQGIEESIQESLAESYQQSIKSQSALDSKTKSDRLPPQQQQQVKAQTLPQGKNNQVNQSNSITEMISDNYSEDFAGSSENVESQKFSNSRNKLQTKATDLAESARYSEEDFESESAASQSQQNFNQAAQNDKTPKMESVQEESVDSSSKSQLHQETSLASEDLTVQQSNRSIDWQINIPQESQRTAQDYSQDQFDQSIQQSIKEESDINDRLDEQSLESNPDETGQSASKSDDIYSKADKIAQEMLDLILAEYKGDNTYIVSCEKKQIDEDIFKNKFPYTLDIKPVEPEIRPPSPTVITISDPNKSVQKIQPKQKTAKEIQDEAYMVKHKKEQDLLKEQLDRVKEYLEFLIRRVDLNQLIQELDTPIKQNPLQVLAQIQAYDDEEPPQVAEQPEQQQILSQVFFNKIDREYFAVKRMQNQKVQDLTVSQEETEKIQNVHNYALFEALNEALDLKRPYKNRGDPMPWSKNTRVVKQATTIEQARQILNEALNKVLEWAQTSAGSKYAPLPPPPTQTQDEFGDEIVLPPLIDGEEERRNQHRQEKLGQLMTTDIQETDQLWIDYEVEDTQARFDLADMILSDLAAEIAQFLV